MAPWTPAQGHRSGPLAPNVSRFSIEVSTVTKPPTPLVPAPSPDEDPTGVRALLSSLPAPDPMPEHLVKRINASLAAEHAQRAAGAEDASVSPLLATRRGRRGRFVFAMAGAAAAVGLVTVVGNGLVDTDSTETSAGPVTATSTSNPKDAAGAEAQGSKPLAPSAPPLVGGAEQSSGKDLAAAAPGAVPAPSAAKSSKPAAGIASGGAVVTIRQSGTRYTKPDFVMQAKTLGQPPRVFATREARALSIVGPVGTPSGLLACLSALGAGAAQLVWADVAMYEGQPAVIIVAATKGVSIAYVVGPQCSKTTPEVLRPATRLG